MIMGTRPQIHTLQGYDLFEVISALQKEIRRCNLDAALYWGVELHASGFSNYAWKRMLIMSVEDVGMADPMVAVHVNALHEIAKKLEKKDDKRQQDRLPFFQAIVILANSMKSRYIDWLVNVKVDEHFAPAYRLEVPDYALDIHTRRGKAMGKTIRDFLTEGSVLANHRFVANEEELKRICAERWMDPDKAAKYPKVEMARKVSKVEEPDDADAEEGIQPTLF